MNSRLRVVATVFSLLISLSTIALWIRSYLVYDTISRSNWSSEPLNDWARAYATSSGRDIKFISRGEGASIELWRGHITFQHGVTEDPTSRWDPAFERDYVDHPHWNRDAHDAADEGYVPGGGAKLSGVFGWLGFADVERLAGLSAKPSYHWITLPLWPIAIISLILPAIFLRALVRDRFRRAHNMCLRCGYDLRETIERCPECGWRRESNQLEA